MKIRKGFVSNSSSSSFILSKDSYESVFDLAKTMIPAREWDSDKELIKKIEEAEIKGMDPNTSITFGSCNYETYIVKYKDYYLISTCNNHSWEDQIDDGYNHFPKELRSIVDVDWDSPRQYGSPEGEAFEDLEGVVSKLSSFWYAEYDVGGKPLSYEDPEREKHDCSEHYYDIIKIKGKKKPVCVVCYGLRKEKEAKEKIKKQFKSMSILEKISFVEDKIISLDSHLTKTDKKKIFEVLEEVKRLL